MAAQLADATANSIDHEFRMLHANGKWVWLRVRCEMVRQPTEPGLHLIGIAVDVTEQKTLVEMTAAADLRLRDAIETIPEAFVLWDADNRLVLCNSNFQELHNLPDPAIAAGISYEDVVAAGRKHVIRTKVMSEGPTVPGARTFEAQLDDGHWLHISERRTKDGGYVSVGTDITPLKLHEKKLIDSEQRLIATIADLRNSQHKLETQARQLSEMAQKYADEKNRAEEANQTKSKFLANMSHELRTPLNAVIGFSEIMESGMFGALGADKYYEYCRDIKQSGQYLLDVINDILDMSKIEAGRIKLDLEEVELDPILADAMRVVTRARAGQAPQGHLQHRRRRALQGRPARREADRAQSAVQRRQVHARRRRDRGAGPAVARRGVDRHPGHRHRHPARRLEEARAAVRAGRKPAHQDAPRIGPGARHRQIADRAARRRDADFLPLRLRHDRRGALPDRRPASRAGQEETCCLSVTSETADESAPA